MKRAVYIALGLVFVFGAVAQEPTPPKWVEEGLLSADEAADGFFPLFNGKDLDGWWIRGSNKNAFKAVDGKILVTGEKDGDYIFTNDQYDNFVLRYDYRCVSGEGNSGVGIRTPKEGDPAYAGMEIQVLRPGWPNVWQRPGALYSVVPPKVDADKPFGEWNSVEVLCDGPRVRTVMNGMELYDAKMTDYTKETIKEPWQHTLAERPQHGFIGLQDHEDQVEFRHIRVKVLGGGEGWTALFNGKDTTGWQVLNDPVWKVTPEGWLQVSGPQGWDKGRNAIRTAASYDNFELSVSFRPHAPRANSGVFFRGTGDDPWPQNYEAQINNHDPKNMTGAIFDQAAATELRAADDRWNTMRVTADGPHITVWVNGKTVADYQSPKHATCPNGWISLQGHDPASIVDFKDICIKPITK